MISYFSVVPEYWVTPGDLTCGVVAHELAHNLLLLSDLFDTGNDSKSLGKWSLMSGGAWNGTLGNSPDHPDLWSRT